MGVAGLGGGQCT